MSSIARHDRPLAILVALLLLLGAAWAVATNPSHLERDVAQERLDAAGAPLGPEHTLGQSFLSRRSGLHRIEFLAVRHEPDREIPAEARVCLDLERLDDPSAGPTTTCLPVGGVAHNQTLTFDLPPQRDSRGASYRLTLRSDQDIGLSVWLSNHEAYADGQAWEDGAPRSGDLYFRTYYDYHLTDALCDLAGGLGHRAWPIVVTLVMLLVPGMALLLLVSPGRRLEPVVALTLAAALSLAYWPLLLLWVTSLGLRLGPLGAWLAVALPAGAAGARIACERWVGPGRQGRPHPGLAPRHPEHSEAPCLAGDGAQHGSPPSGAADRGPALGEPSRPSPTPVSPRRWAWRGHRRASARGGLFERGSEEPCSSLHRHCLYARDAWPYVALAVVMALVVATRALQVRDLVVPAWVDSVHHVMITRLIADGGQVPATYRPFMPVDDFHYHFGFHAAAAALTWLSGLSVDQAVLLLGQALNVLAPLATYTMAWWIGRNRWAGAAAALVVGALCYMPAYYVTWGRYTQLAGLDMLPALMLATSWALERRRGAVLLVAPLLAGMVLTHYRVLVFYALWVVAQGALVLWRVRRSPSPQSSPRVRGEEDFPSPLPSPRIRGEGDGPSPQPSPRVRGEGDWPSPQLSPRARGEEDGPSVQSSPPVRGEGDWPSPQPSPRRRGEGVGRHRFVLPPALWGEDTGEGRLAPIAVRGALCGGLALLLALPWVVGFVARVAPGFEATYGGWAGGEGGNAFPAELLNAGWTRPLLYLAAGGALWGFVRRRGEAMVTAVWVGLCLLTANLHLLGLADTWLITNSAVVIAFWLPVGALCGWLVGDLGRLLAWVHLPRLGRLGRRPVSALLTAAVLTLGAVGSWHQVDIVNPVTVLATEEDMEAIAWARDHTPHDALFLINTGVWQAPMRYGTDAGWWLNVLADRRTTLPSLLYMMGGQDYFGRINALGIAVEQADSLDDPAFLERLRAEGVSHVFVGTRGGRLLPRDLDQSAHYRTLYAHGPVRIYEVMYP